MSDAAASGLFLLEAAAVDADRLWPGDFSLATTGGVVTRAGI